jgi:hypothetical protein
MKVPRTIPTSIKEFIDSELSQLKINTSNAKFEELIVSQTMLIIDLIAEKQNKLQGSIARMTSIHKQSKLLDKDAFNALIYRLYEEALIDNPTKIAIIDRAAELRDSPVPLGYKIVAK